MKKTIIKYPSELKKPLIIEGQPCKYILDLIDGEIYGTNDYAIYHLYDGLFFEQKPTDREPLEKRECHIMATPEAWKQAMEKEKERYAAGYRWVSDWVTIRGFSWKKGRWVKQEAS